MAEWTLVGAWQGGTVSSVALSPNFAVDGMAMAATGAGIYRTTDGGRHWQRTINGFADLSAVAVTFAPTRDIVPAPAFASAESGRLYRSTDGGVVWSEISSWGGLGLATTIALSPDYAQDKTLFVGTPAGVFRSFDDGESWEEASFGLLDLEILCLACAPDFAETGVLWAGTALGGFYRSRNRGLAWRESGVGLPDAAIQCLAVVAEPENVPVLFVGTESDGVYRSDNQGALWERIGEGLAGTSVNALAISWDARGALLLAGTNSGLYSLGTANEKWEEHWHTTENGEFLALALAATPQGTVLAATFQESLAISADGGHSWQSTGAELTAHTPPLLFPTAAGPIYGFDTDGALAFSPDGGTTWSPLLIDGEMRELLALAVGNDEREDLYAATDDLLWRFAPQPGAVESGAPQPGAVWHALPLPTPHVTTLAISPDHSADQQLLLANLTGDLFFSETAGATWQPVTHAWNGQAILHLLFSPRYREDHLIRVITAQGNAAGNYAVTLWHSSDLTQGWTEVAALETEIPSVLVAQAADDQANTIFLATGHRVIKFYTDSVQDTVAVAQHFFDEGLRVTALALSPTFADDQTLFAATTGGLCLSADGGATWSRCCENPNGLPLVALLTTGLSDQEQLRAVTIGGDTWSLQITAHEFLPVP